MGEDVDAQPSDVDMADAPNGPTQPRSASARRRYMEAQRAERDQLLLELRNACAYIDAPPPPPAIPTTTVTRGRNY